MTSVSRHRSLESAFAAPTTPRADGLAGLLSPKRTSAQVAATDEPEVKPKPETQPKQEPSRPAARKAPPEPRPGRATSQVFNVGIYLPPNTLEAVREATRVRGCTYADVLVEAFDKVDHAAITAAFTPEQTAAAPGSMPRRNVKQTGEAGIQRQFRLSGEQRDWLDEQVRYHNAPSRSALVATVLALHFE